jgi:Arc/MetJ-type ribon-helix-helix transcriptional regulator
MDVHLPPDVEALVRAAVDAGRFPSADAFVAEAVRHYVADDAAPAPRRRIWDVAAKLRAGVPEEQWAEVPRDGAAEHDHYIYGTPKERPAS